MFTLLSNYSSLLMPNQNAGSSRGAKTDDPFNDSVGEPLPLVVRNIKDVVGLQSNIRTLAVHNPGKLDWNFVAVTLAGLTAVNESLFSRVGEQSLAHSHHGENGAVVAF